MQQSIGKLAAAMAEASVKPAPLVWLVSCEMQQSLTDDVLRGFAQFGQGIAPDKVSTS